MKSGIVILYFLLPMPSVVAIENITVVCEEPSFLKCTNKNKKECVNSFKLSLSYCYKKHSAVFENKPLIKKDMDIYKKCYLNSLHAYYDDNSDNFNNCMSKTKYMERLNELIEKHEK